MMIKPGITAGVVALLLVAGCASHTAGARRSGTPDSSGSSARTQPGGAASTDVDMPGAPGVARVGLGWNGRTVVLAMGQRLAVTLAAGWTPPRVDAAGPGAVLTEMSATGGYPGPAAADAVFRATRRGVAVLTSHTDYRCLHTRPTCARPQGEFQLTVRVLPPVMHPGAT